MALVEWSRRMAAMMHKALIKRMRSKIHQSRCLRVAASVSARGRKIREKNAFMGKSAGRRGG